MMANYDAVTVNQTSASAIIAAIKPTLIKQFLNSWKHFMSKKRVKWCDEVIINGALCRFSSSWHMDLTPNKSSILLLAINIDWIRRKLKEMEQTCLSFNYRMILFCPLWLSLVFLMFLPLCRAFLPRWSARCQHPKFLQFERETAVIVLFSPLQICVSVLVQLTIVLYFVACVLQLQRVGDMGVVLLEVFHSLHGLPGHTELASQMHLYAHAQMQVQLQPC